MRSLAVIDRGQEVVSMGPPANMHWVKGAQIGEGPHATVFALSRPDGVGLRYPSAAVLRALKDDRRHELDRRILEWRRRHDARIGCVLAQIYGQAPEGLIMEPLKQDWQPLRAMRIHSELLDLSIRFHDVLVNLGILRQEKGRHQDTKFANLGWRHLEDPMALAAVRERGFIARNGEIPVWFDLDGAHLDGEEEKPQRGFRISSTNAFMDPACRLGAPAGESSDAYQFLASFMMNFGELVEKASQLFDTTNGFGRHIPRKHNPHERDPDVKGPVEAAFVETLKSRSGKTEISDGARLLAQRIAIVIDSGTHPDAKERRPANELARELEPAIKALQAAG